MPDTLRWHEDFQVDGPWLIQTEHTRGEPVCYYLGGMSHQDRIITSRDDIETCFFGRGGKAKVKAAAQRIFDGHRKNPEESCQST